MLKIVCFVNLVKLVGLVVLLNLLTACNLKLEAPILPNVKGAPQSTITGSVPGAEKGDPTASGSATPSSVPPPNATMASLTEDSRKETQNKSKKFLFNFLLSDALLKLKSIKPDNYCVQLAQLSNGLYVVDFTDSDCPSGQGLVLDSSIRFTLVYIQKGDSEAQLVNAGNVVGDIQADWSFPIAIVTDLCSGNYSTRCTLETKSGLLFGFK